MSNLLATVGLLLVLVGAAFIRWEWLRYDGLPVIYLTWWSVGTALTGSALLLGVGIWR